MTAVPFIKGYILLIIGILFAVLAPAQSIPSPKIESPNVAGIDNFGDIPVSLFTGVPDISIPIHTLTYGAINVPIALKYHPSSVKVTQHAGWVGTGWDLQSVGCINRTVRNVPDEICYDGNGLGVSDYIPYYPGCINFPYATWSDGSDFLNNDAIWASQSQLVGDWTANVPNTTVVGYHQLDQNSDEYSFNFLNYSGKFYYSGQTKGWQVTSPDNIKITVNGFLENYQITAALATNSYGGQFIAYNNQTRAFQGFTLTVPDGTQYVFGGTATGDANGVEFYSPLSPAGGYFIANSWFLTKIIDPDKNEVDFSYNRTYPTCDVPFTCNNFTFSSIAEGGGFLNASNCTSFSSGNINTTPSSGTFQWTVYLNKIISPNETIQFNLSKATCLRDAAAYFLSSEQTGTPADAYYLNWITNDPVDNIQWEQLDSIVLLNTAKTRIKQFKFLYSNSTSQRLTLNSFIEADKLGNPVEQFNFSYNNIAGMPAYTGNYEDHWGFYNHQNVQGVSISQMASTGLRNTDTSYVKTGLLTKIAYPTGGYTQFTWQAHDYSQVVSAGRGSLNSATGYAGGCRIAEIQSFLADGTVALDKKYYYKRGYSAGTNVNTLSSSGILNGIPQYTFTVTGRPTVNNTAQISYYQENFNSLSTYSYNGEGSYIGYDQVVEVNADNSYTVNYFTSYGPDLNGISHFDSLPVGYIGWKNGEDVYMPMSTLDIERGKLIGAFTYTSGNILLQKTLYTFRNDAARFNNYARFTDFNGLYGCEAYDKLIFASARKQYTYDYYPVTIKNYKYDQQGNNPVIDSTVYTYNANNLSSTKKRWDSKGDSLLTTYHYPTDGTDVTSQAMAAAHILSPIVLDSTAKDGQPLTVRRINYFSPSSGIYVPQNLQIQVSTNAAETRQYFNQYDAYGNVEEIQKASDMREVYLWGYHHQYPVTKIVGSNYATVSGFVNQTVLDSPSSDQALRTELNKIRTGLAGTTALVNTYTYAPMIGMTSQTDANNRITYYEYDFYGRLRVVRDQDSNIVKKVCYNYAGEPVNCTIYPNAADSGVYARICGPDSTTGPNVTYRVPAGTYFSDLSQTQADSFAHSDVLANAQNYANAHGTCICQPSFAWNYANVSASNVAAVGVQLNGTTITFALVLYSYPFGSATLVNVGNLTCSSCFPSAARTVPMVAISGSTTYLFNVIISTTGYVQLQLVSSTPPPGTGGVAFPIHGSYDLLATTYYNAGQSGSFTRNNCPAGQVGSSVPYSVPAYFYTSTVNQATADQLAVTAFNTNGQINANNIGTCTVQSGTFTANTAGGWATLGTPSITITGSTVTCSIATRDATFTSWTTPFVIGTLGGGAVPGTARSFNTVTGANTWAVTISTSGTITVTLVSGTPPPSGVVSLVNISYSK